MVRASCVCSCWLSGVRIGALVSCRNWRGGRQTTTTADARHEARRGVIRRGLPWRWGCVEERETLQFMVGVLHRLRPFVPLPRAFRRYRSVLPPPLDSVVTAVLRQGRFYGRFRRIRRPSPRPFKVAIKVHLTMHVVTSWSLHAADPSPPRMAATPRVTAATAGTAAASTPPRGKRGVEEKKEKQSAPA